MESVKAQTYPNIITIVHTDDPRDEYVTGDIIIRGRVNDPNKGDGGYNLYNNDLLKSIPDGPGWYHFLDDDDIYASDNVIESLVAKSLNTHVNVAHVERWNGTIWPDKWGKCRSFQTECFFMHTDHRLKASWWANRGGDHHYSKQLTSVMPINWIDDVLICRMQEKKGYGKRMDKNNKTPDYSNVFPPDRIVPVIGLTRIREPLSERIGVGELKQMPYKRAYELEQQGAIKITY